MTPFGVVFSDIYYHATYFLSQADAWYCFCRHDEIRTTEGAECQRLYRLLWTDLGLENLNYYFHPSMQMILNDDYEVRITNQPKTCLSLGCLYGVRFLDGLI